MWRFCGNQLSIQPDRLRLYHVKAMVERALPCIYERHRPLISRNDCAVLMLPIKAYLATSRKARRRMRFEAYIRVLWMFVRNPAATLRAIRDTQFSIQTLKQTLLPMFLLRLGLAPKDIHPDAIRPAVHGETALHSGGFHEAEK